MKNFPSSMGGEWWFSVSVKIRVNKIQRTDILKKKKTHIRKTHRKM